MNDERFRCASKLLPATAWLLPILPLIPIMLGRNGQFGLECNSHLCTVINVYSEGLPLITHQAATSPISLQLVVVAMLLLVMNIGTYLKVLVTPIP